MPTAGDDILTTSPVPFFQPPAYNSIQALAHNWSRRWIRPNPAAADPAIPPSELETLMDENTALKLYGTSWCGGSRRVRLLLDTHSIPYQWIDIDADPEAGKYLETLNNGFRSVPTLVWPDGSKLVEPSNDKVAEKLGIKLN